VTEPHIEGLRRRYAAERDKRLRPDGNGQYVEMKGDLAHFADDPHTKRRAREPKHDHVTVTLVGGGFAGLLAGARLKETGIDDVRVVDKAGGFGGTWYWNRYPGARCDTPSMIYLPLLEETGYMPAERYARAPEILEHCHRIAVRYGLGDLALFHTGVTALEWDPAFHCWIVQTNRGDEFTSQFVVIGTGALHVPKLPGIPGIGTFGGRSFHASRWDYAYTGGDAAGAPMDRLADKRVAVIGTGATAVQCIPHLARACRELFVFQRTPSSVDVRGNQPIDPEWFVAVTPSGWQERWLENFCATMTATEDPAEDLVNDRWTDMAQRIRARLAAPRLTSSPVADLLADIEAADAEKMDEIRARVDAVVRDPVTAERLKPWYRHFCKRPCFHDDYLSTYNLPAVHLIDTDGKGAERISPGGVSAAGTDYPVDCIIYASGFEVGIEPTRRYGFDMTGRHRARLSDHWSEGMRSLHGTHVHGFPNAFFVQPAQGANFVANVTHNLADTAKTIAAVLSHMRASGFAEVNPTAEAETAWTQQLTSSPVMTSFLASCTPGYYNNEGHGGKAWALLKGYQRGPLAYFHHISQWRESAEFKGLEFSRPTAT
jgi:cation diffusion facilitator CzcD-associated flavoprotein CzcO